MTLPEIFDAFTNLRALIIGDVMVDSYLWGKVDRISPEAPVPIVSVKNREQRLGGAANVALNIKALGAVPILCSVIGSDKEGEDFLTLLTESQLTSEGIIISPNRITTTKHRILAGTQHLLRIDSEIETPINQSDKEFLFQRISLLLPTCDVVIFEDYDKGVLDEEIIQRTIDLAHFHHLPIVVDPKKRNFQYYKKATLFKPNLKELREGLKLDFNIQRPEEVEQVVNLLKQQQELEGVLLTLSEHGVFIDLHQEKKHLPAHIRQIADVSGAGDTVVSIAALSLALHLSPVVIAELANLGGGLVCEYAGVVPVSKDQLLAEAYTSTILQVFS